MRTSLIAKGKQLQLPRLTLRLQSNQIKYRSPIALYLAGKQSYFAPQIAAEIIAGLEQQIPPNLAYIRCFPPAWLEFALTEETVHNWLAEGLQSIVPLTHSLPCPETIHSFGQYVRDRCWQLVQLGVQENLISIPPLSPQEKTTSLPLSRLLETQDWQFLHQLILTRDRLEKVASPQEREKLADQLSTSFCEFHRYCQLFNRQQPHFDQLVFIRLSAIVMTERLLSYLEDDSLYL